jgi:cellulose synthase operon protein YhjU
MGLWNLYFIAKLYLYWLGKIQPSGWLNLLLALCLLAPLQRRWLRWLRQALAIVAAVALLYHEAGQGDPRRILTQLAALGGFSPGYLLELARRVVAPSALYAAGLAVLAFLLLNRWLRVTTFVLLALLALPLWQAGTALAARTARPAAANGTAAQAAGLPAADPGQAGNATAGSYDQQLAAFRSAEASRRVAFPHITDQASAQFNIILLHICSLSWDDLDVANARNHPLLSHFDYVFQNFSSAASYSDPAAMRVLRASCGQEPHRDLYSPVASECHLFAQLARAGFQVQATMNHDGRYDGFRDIVERELGVPGVQVGTNAGLPVALRAFDGSPLAGDYEALARWFGIRAAAGGGPVALYYNSITMHDGNRLLDSNMGSLQSYPVRVNKLLGDVDRLIDLVARSGRKAVIVFIPEHGAALRGGANQVAGLREIPSPQIVHVPVGVKLVGLPAGAARGDGPLSIAEPTSYLALAQLLANLVADSPFRPGAPPLAQYAAGLPQTRLVGENEATVTMQTANGYVIHTPDDVWVEGH